LLFCSESVLSETRCFSQLRMLELGAWPAWSAIAACLIALLVWGRRQRTSTSITDKHSTMAIIGGSFSGLALARKAVDRGLRVVVFEKRHDNSGVWSTTAGLANVGSHLQSDWVVYRDPADQMEYSKLYPSRVEIEQGLALRAQKLKDFGVEFRYGCDVRRIVEDCDGVRVSYLQHCGTEGKLQEEVFSSAHVRTGCLSKTASLHVPGLEYFDGRWGLGVKNGLETLPVKGGRVVIVGMGAFAIENAKRAVELGAHSVTLLSRSAAVVCPRYLIYHGATCGLSLANVLVRSELDARWNELFTALRHSPAAAAAGGVNIEHAIFDYMGCEHLTFTSSSQSDWFYAAVTLGALQVVQGEVIAVEAPRFSARSRSLSVRTAAGVEALPADVLLFCVGQSCDTRLLDGMPLTSVIFGLNGKLTHNLKADTWPEPAIFGPRAPVPMFPILSYGLVDDFADALALAACLDPSMYARWCAASTESCPAVSYISSIRGMDWLGLYWAAFMCGIPEIGREIISIMYDRYESYVTGGSWYCAVVADWDENVNALRQWRHEVHGEPLDESPLPYPWPCPKELRSQRRSKAFYQTVYTLASALGVRRVFALLNRSRLLQVVLSNILVVE